MMFTAYLIDGPKAGTFFPIDHDRDSITIAVFNSLPPLRLIPPGELVKQLDHKLIIYHLWPPVYGSICFYKTTRPKERPIWGPLTKAEIVALLSKKPT